MSLSEAIFAAGCFWGVQAAFDQVPGVVETEVGYIGGTAENPTYERVCRGDTNYAEAVKVKFDDQVVSYQNLLNVFFNLHDPTTLNRQGPDIGTQYRSAIFYMNPEQKKQAEDFIAELNSSNLLKSKIVTEIVPADKFYPAEEYHQKYFQKNKLKGACATGHKGLIRLSEQEWREKLTPERFAILRQKATERPFTGALLHENGQGDFVCAACGQPIFKSDHKFDSGSGWPSFDRAIPGSVREEADFSHGMIRTEVLCARCGSHLGHVFEDGPATTGMRYCINSGSLNFEKQQMP